MIRTQIQFTQEQLEALRRMAETEDCSVSELVRQAVASWISRHSEQEDEKWRRAAAAVGGFSSGLTDVAERHDDYLAEAYGS